MNEPTGITDLVQTAEELTEPVTIGTEAYISEEYARAERDKLWRKVWQQAGRVEEIPEVGNYLTYDILDDSIVIVRTAPDKISRLPQCLPASRPPAGRYAHRRAQRLRQEKAVRLRLPRLAVQPGGRMHPCAREGRLEGRADSRAHAAWARSRSTPGAAGSGSIWIPTANPCATISSPPPACSIPSSCRTCAADGASGSSSTATGRSPWRRSTKPTTSRRTHPEFMKFGDFRGWARAQGKHSNIGYDAPKGLEENQAKLRLGRGVIRASRLRRCRSIPGSR